MKQLMDLLNKQYREYRNRMNYLAWHLRWK